MFCYAYFHNCIDLDIFLINYQSIDTGTGWKRRYFAINWKKRKNLVWNLLEKGLKKAELFNTSGKFFLVCFHYNMCVVYLILVTLIFSITQVSKWIRNIVPVMNLWFFFNHFHFSSSFIKSQIEKKLWFGGYFLGKELKKCVFLIHDKYVFLIQASNRFAKILYKLALEQGRKEGILLSIGKRIEKGRVNQYLWNFFALLFSL